eukprot:526338_1
MDQSYTVHQNIQHQQQEATKRKLYETTREQLQITIVNAQNMPAMGSFVEIAVNGETQKTSVQKDTLTPTWNETLILNGISVHDSMSIQLNVLNRFGKKNKIGKVENIKFMDLLQEVRSQLDADIDGIIENSIHFIFGKQKNIEQQQEEKEEEKKEKMLDLYEAIMEQLQIENINKWTIIHAMYLQLAQNEKNNKIRKNIMGISFDNNVSEHKVEQTPIKLLHHLLMQFDYKLVVNPIIEIRKRSIPETPFSFLMMHFDKLDVYIKDLIHSLLYFEDAEEPDLTIVDHRIFVVVFRKIIDKQNDQTSKIEALLELMEICQVAADLVFDENRFNPLHYIMNSTQNYVSLLPSICVKYPLWMIGANKNGHIPLQIAVQQKNINNFYCLCRFMTQTGININHYFLQRHFVSDMIQFGLYLLGSNEERFIYSKCFTLLLTTFNYNDIFFWNDHDNFISLIKAASISGYLKDCTNILKECGIDESTINAESKSEIQSEENTKIDVWKNKRTPDETLNKKLMLKKLETDAEEKCKRREHKAESRVISSAMIKSMELCEARCENRSFNKKRLLKIMEIDKQNIEIEEELKLNEWKDDDMEIANKAVESENTINWIELIYSTTVETFSVFDLITDVVVFMQLFKSRNIWWTTWMMVFLISPYLVSHSSLVTLVLKQIEDNFNEIPFWKSIAFWLLSTPMALIYAFIIDLVFMLFSLFSTLCLITAFCVIKPIKLVGCRAKVNISDYDIRDYLDEAIFQNIFKMNKTEIVGYRRLRTIAQLIFESIPQILLQIRILWVIQENKQTSAAENDVFEIDVNTIIWSVSLALTHLLFEVGIISLDKIAFRTGLLQYCLICLGGRVEWVPFQNLIEDIVENQVYIYRDGNDEEYDNSYFDVKLCKLDEIMDHEKQQIVSLAYENIHVDVLGMTYAVNFQFSKRSIHYLIKKLMNTKPMSVPTEFNLQTVNSALCHFVKYLLIKSQIQLGPRSCDNVGIDALYELYTISSHKMPLNVSSIEKSSCIQKIIQQNEEDKRLIVEQLKFIFEGELGAIKWIYNCLPIELEADDRFYLKQQILERCLPSDTNDVEFIRLDILRKCYQNQFFIATDCEEMKVIKKTVEAYFINECRQDESWFFVIILLLFYSRGNIFQIDCINGCCKLSYDLTNSLRKYVPKIKIAQYKIPFEFIEHWKHKPSPSIIECMLIDTTKNWIIHQASIENEYDISSNSEVYGFIKLMQNKNYDQDVIDAIHSTLFINEIKTDYSNIALCDGLIFDLRLKYSQYIQNTLPIEF